MKTKSILLATLVGAAATAAMSANAGVHFGFSFGLPAPVIVTPAIPAAPTPCDDAVPPCPGADYVWSPGYWSYTTTGYVWIRGAWNYHPRAVYYDRDDFRGHDRDFDRDRDHGHDRDYDHFRGHDNDDHRGDRR